MELASARVGFEYHERRARQTMPDPGRSQPDDAERQGQLAATIAAADHTISLIERAKAGDAAATDALARKCLPILTRWARGRLPAYARDLKETQDLVQESLVHALQNLGRFEPRGQGALQAYLRQAVANRIRDEIRRVKRRPAAVELIDQHADSGASPLEQVVGLENLRRYEAALQRLRPSDRELIIDRLEMQCTYEELAANAGKPSADAARVAVIRAVYRLVKELQHDE
jgi:RNA polymerase sigma factor (sigma-70 family)